MLAFELASSGHLLTPSIAFGSPRSENTLCSSSTWRGSPVAEPGNGMPAMGWKKPCNCEHGHIIPLMCVADINDSTTHCRGMRKTSQCSCRMDSRNNATVAYQIWVERLKVIKEPQKQRRVPAAALYVEHVKGFVLLLLLLLLTLRLVLGRVHTTGILHRRLLFPACGAVVKVP
jgi:hypothetical protein